MPISMRDNSNLDPVLRLDIKNRDVEVPDDILIASYANLVDKGRKEIGNPFTNNHKVFNVANKAQSVLSVVQKALDESRLRAGVEITETNVPFSQYSYMHIISFGPDQPEIEMSGTYNEIITINTSLDCKIASCTFKGTNDWINDQNQKYIIFEGFGIPGNEGLHNMFIPSIQIVQSNELGFGGPSDALPFTINKDNVPAVHVTDIGTTNNPMIKFRFDDMNLSQIHYLTINWI